MAITISDTPNWANTNSSYSYTVGSNSNRLLVAELLWYGATDRNVSSATYNSVALTKARGSHYDIGGYFLTVEIWYLIAPASGSNTFAWSLSGAVDGISSSLQSGDGFKQSAQPDAASSYTTNGTASPLSENITTVADQCFIFDAVINGGGWTNIAAVSPQVDGASTYASYKGAVSVGSNSMAWTYTGTSFASHALASFSPAPVTNSFIPRLMTLGAG